MRQWSVFGKTLCRALPELMGATLGLVLLSVAYAQMAILVGCCPRVYQGRASPRVCLYLCLSHSLFPLVPTLCTTWPEPSWCCALGRGAPLCALLSPGTCRLCSVWGSGLYECGVP